MPIFEFKCAACGSKFESILDRRDSIERGPCPTCNSERIENVFSPFRVKPDYFESLNPSQRAEALANKAHWEKPENAAKIRSGEITLHEPKRMSPELRPRPPVQ